MEVETQVRIGFAALAIDDTRFRAALRHQDNGLATEVNVPIPVTAVGSVSDENSITGGRGVNPGLNGPLVYWNANGRGAERRAQQK